MNSEAPYVLDLAIHRVSDSTRVELSHDDPSSQGRATTVRGEAALLPDVLLGLQADQAEYGRELTRQVLADPQLRARFLSVERAAQAANRWLRLTISIDRTAADLHALRWELLRHPETDAPLATSERILLSRFLFSEDWRPVQVRARAELVALVAVSAPVGPRFSNMRLAPVNAPEEVARVRVALEGGDRVGRGQGAGVEVRLVDAPLTVERLTEALRKGVDVVYLVSHGAFNKKDGTAWLFLQKDDGDVAPLAAEALTARISEARTPPRLIVLASCQSAGAGDLSKDTVHATLAAKLARAGVPAVVAMQGNISMETVKTLMPAFFEELLVDGQIDRALAAARGRVRAREDAWMPALFSRLRDGKLWYTAGFQQATEAERERTWRRLLPFVRSGEIVPILGPELCSAVFGAPGDRARTLAASHRFPLSAADGSDLPRVSQFIQAYTARRALVHDYRDELQRQLTELHPTICARESTLERQTEAAAATLRAEDPTDPYALLARLNASIYATTGFDSLLEYALTEVGRRPQTTLSRWRHNAAPISADLAPLPEPSVAEPVVYHLFGALGDNETETLVLTEDDHFDAMMATTAGSLTPDRVSSALVASSLLFLGFRLTDWTFRVLFRLLMSLEGKGQLKDYCHVAVQLDPELQTVADAKAAKDYLARYFGDQANIEIYWGSTRDFLAELHRQLARASGPKPAEPEPKPVEAQADSEEWSFDEP